jgi:hypothetical protein
LSSESPSDTPNLKALEIKTSSEKEYNENLELDFKLVPGI